MYSILGTITFSMAALHTTSQQGNDILAAAWSRHSLAHLHLLAADLLYRVCLTVDNALADYRLDGKWADARNH